MFENIVITGTPGTGKTSVTRLLASKGYKIIDLFEFAKLNKCILEFDETRDTQVIDMDRLENSLQKFLLRELDNYIIEGHYADIVPDEFVKKCFVLSCPIEVLKKRLVDRNYEDTKLQENIQAEIMQVCYLDAVDNYSIDKIIKIDTSIQSVDQVCDLIIKQIQG